jgi:predicted kinase
VTEHLYRKVLLEAAEAALEAGLSVVVDATFLRQDLRQAFIELARRRRIGFGILACSVPLDLALVRLLHRRAEEEDPSEADAGVVMAQLDSLEPLDQGEKAWIVDGDDRRLRFDPGELPIP